MILSHVIGPLGLIMLINTIASLLEIDIMKQMSVAVGGDMTGDAYKNYDDLRRMVFYPAEVRGGVTDYIS